MKCPYRKITTEIDGLVIEDFAECYKGDCPYFGRKVQEKRYEGGYREIIKPECRRVYEQPPRED